MSLPDIINVTKWVEENKAQFLPPVCNKMMHTDGQLKLFFVGGPNQRKDYHIEEGEELFYMTRGDMELKMLIDNKFVSQPIRQGQLFLLPANVFHSPQRSADTIGWVIERERPPTEMDGLRYFVESADGVPTLLPLFERYVHMRDLGSQVAEIIAEYRRSAACLTGAPTVDSGADNSSAPAPVAYKPEVRPPKPVTLADWLAEKSAELDASGQDGTSALPVFPTGKHQFLVEVVGRSDGRRQFLEAGCETWLLQVAGESKVVVVGEAERLLGADDSLLVPTGVAFCVVQEPGGRLLKASQDRGRKSY